MHMGEALSLREAFPALSLSIGLGNCKFLSGRVPKRRCGAGKKETMESRPRRRMHVWYCYGPRQRNIAV